MNIAARAGTRGPAGKEEAVASPAPVATVARVFTHRNLLAAAGLFLAAYAVLAALQLRFGIPLAGVSATPYHVYQAWSFLHGRWDLTVPPGTITDLVVLHGKTYMYYGPTPALLLLPFVAVFGRATSDILFTAVVSALNLPLLYLLFEQARATGLTRRSPMENVLIALLCYLGSITLGLSVGGGVWFTAHIVGLTCTLLALPLALRGHYAWAAALLAAAVFSRYIAVLGFPLLLYLAWQAGGREHALERFLASLWRRRPDWAAVPWRRLLPVAAGAAATLALYLVRNLVVTGSPPTPASPPSSLASIPTWPAASITSSTSPPTSSPISLASPM